MKQLPILFSFLFISLNGFCDTLDYWHVYINDSLIGEFNSNSKQPTIDLKQANINKNDVITVRYASDNPCVDCIYVLDVLIEVKEQTPQVETDQNFGKLSLRIGELQYFQKKYGIDKYHFNLNTRRERSIPNSGTYLFELNFI